MRTFAAALLLLWLAACGTTPVAADATTPGDLAPEAAADVAPDPAPDPAADALPDPSPDPTTDPAMDAGLEADEIGRAHV